MQIDWLPSAIACIKFLMHGKEVLVDLQCPSADSALGKLED
jgi:hypothetical protein